MFSTGFMMLLLIATLATVSCGDNEVEMKRVASTVESSFRSSHDAASEFRAYEELLSATQKYSELSYSTSLYDIDGDTPLENEQAFKILRSGDASKGVVVEINILHAPYFKESTPLLTFKHRLIDERTLFGLLSGQ